MSRVASSLRPPFGRPVEEWRERRLGHERVGKTDLEHDGERRQEKQQQPEVGKADDRAAPQAVALAGVGDLAHSVSTTEQLESQLR